MYLELRLLTTWFSGLAVQKVLAHDKFLRAVRCISACFTCCINFTRLTRSCELRMHIVLHFSYFVPVVKAVFDGELAQELLREAGAIPKLVGFLQDDGSSLVSQETAATALLALCFENNGAWLRLSLRESGREKGLGTVEGGELLERCVGGGV